MKTKATMSRPTRGWTRREALGLAALAAVGAASGCSDRKASDGGGSAQGVTDTEILIGGSFPFSGPFAVFAETSEAIQAYFDSVNADGGIDGRQIVYSAADDGYDPARLAANARQAVQQDQVAAFMSFGGPNVAIQPFMNESRVPQIVMAGNTEFGQTEQYPYSHAWWPDLTWESEYTTRFVLENPADFPDPIFGLISLNNTLADSHVAGTVNGLGDQADALFPAANQIRIEPALADYSSQVNQLRAAGVTVLYMNPGTAGQVSAINYIKQIGWPVSIFLYSASSGYQQVLSPAGLDASAGIYTAAWLKDPADPRWDEDEGMAAYREVMAKHGAGVDPEGLLTANGYGAAQAVVTALQAIDGEITPDAINEAWLDIREQPSDVLVPGSSLDTGPGGRLVYRYQLMRFDGASWQDAAPLADVRELGIAV